MGANNHSPNTPANDGPTDNANAPRSRPNHPSRASGAGQNPKGRANDYSPLRDATARSFVVRGMPAGLPISRCKDQTASMVGANNHPPSLQTGNPEICYEQKP